VRKDQIYSQRIEKHVLGGLINNPRIFSDIERFVNEKDFFFDVHNTIFCVIRSILSSGQKLDKILLAEKIQNLGISFKDDIEIYRYIDEISFTYITAAATIEASKELLKYRIRREILDTSKEVGSYIRKCGAAPIDEIIANCDELYNKKMRTYALDDEPIDLFSGIGELIEERGNNPQEEFGLMTPWSEFNNMYGGLRAGNVYAIVSRPGQGKTTWINNLCMKTGLANNVKVLFLDTEMETMDIQFRMAASLTGVSMWHLETGNWRKNKELVQRVRTGIKDINKSEYQCFHAFVGNKNIDQICSLVRRWYLSEVGRGNQCIIAYDYVKLTGERVSQNWGEYQAIGDKIDKLKKLAEEIQAPLITAMQMNRSGERGAGGALVDDSSAISLSDRLQWFASFVAIFRRKTLEEVAEDTQNFGTHKLIPLKTRFQGQNAAGHHDLVRRTAENGTVQWFSNFLNFNVENFDVEERGSLRHVIEAQSERGEDVDERRNDGATEF